jgi:hypothetical protein
MISVLVEAKHGVFNALVLISRLQKEPLPSATVGARPDKSECKENQQFVYGHCSKKESHSEIPIYRCQGVVINVSSCKKLDGISTS